MFSKIKTNILSYVLSNARDVRFIGMIAFGVLILLTSWSGVRIIELNYELQKEIAALAAKNEVRKLENQNIKLKNQYLATDTYLELAARQQLGRGGKDEKLILVPKEIALANSPRLIETATENAPADSAPGYLKNIRAWRNFYFPSGG